MLNISANYRVLAVVACMLAPSFVLAQGVPPTASGQWRNEAIVNSERVCVADLLAPDADTQLRLAASRIDLGRSPEPGSYRVFNALELEEAVEATGIPAPPAQVVVRRRGWPPSPEKLSVALAAAKFPLVPVDLLGSPETRTANSWLRVTAALPGHIPETTLIRFECRERSDCAPFWGEIESTGKFPQTQLRPSVSPRAQPRVATLVRPGQTALLISDGPGMEIRLPVCPLARAGLNDRVKVFDPKTRRTFLARVKAANLVVSDLEEAR